MKHSIPKRCFLLGLCTMLILTLAAFRQPSDSFQTDSPPSSNQELDLSNAILQIEDLPSGFQEMAESQKDSMRSILELWQRQIQETSSLEIVNFTGYWTADPQNPHFVISGLVLPLSSKEQILVDQAFARPDVLIEQLSGMVRGGGASLLSGVQGIGESRLAFSAAIGSGSLLMHMDYIVARRGPVLVEVAYVYLQDQQPVINAIEIARTLDQRVSAVVGPGTGVGFRPAGLLVPQLTTHIPTPLDVSTRPAVVGTNLFLAALLMLPFAAAVEVFTRTLGAHEEAFERFFHSIIWFDRFRAKLKGLTRSRLRCYPAWRDLIQFLAVIFFYGLVFSLLDHTWNPFSLQGVVLFVSMTIAYGVVGLTGDYFQWRAIRRWGMPAGLSVRLKNAAIAILSTATSRLFSVVPGLMFGTPEALTVDERVLNEAQQGKLLRISVLTFSLVGLISWLLTVITAILQRLPLGKIATDSIGGLEAFLLVIFAVTLENLFVQMLGFPGGFGQKLKRKNRWVWLTCLVGITFIFYHTLINPRGELAQAVRTGNVQLFCGVVVGFVLLAFGLHFIVNRQKRQAEATSVPAAPLETGLPPAAEAIATLEVSETAESIKKIYPSAVRLSLDEPKICPICSNEIKAEARICRFCRSRFLVALRGYCLTEHDVVNVGENDRCSCCGGEVADIHVESYLLEVSPSQPGTGLPQNHHPPQARLDSDTRLCPVCGQIIKAQARICRFCRVQLG